MAVRQTFVAHRTSVDRSALVAVGCAAVPSACRHSFCLWLCLDSGSCDHPLGPMVLVGLAVSLHPSHGHVFACAPVSAASVADFSDRSAAVRLSGAQNDAPYHGRASDPCGCRSCPCGCRSGLSMRVRSALRVICVASLLVPWPYLSLFRHCLMSGSLALAYFRAHVVVYLLGTARRCVWLDFCYRSALKTHTRLLSPVVSVE